MANVAAKRNNSILLPYRVLHPENGRKLSVLAAFVLAQIWSFAKKGNDINFGYKWLSERLNISKATCSRSVGKIQERDDFTVERNGGRATSYSTTFDLGNGAYIDFPLWLTEPFDVTYNPRAKGENYKKGRRQAETVTKTVTLTPAEQLVFAHLYTKTKELNKKGSKPIRTSPALISAMLGGIICPRTVKSALLKLENLELIYQHYASLNAHGEGLGAYVANLSYFRAYERYKKQETRRAEKAQEKAQATDNAPKTAKEIEIEHQNREAERASFYAQRRDVAVRNADRYVDDVCNRFPRLREIKKELNDMKYPLARAELEGGEGYKKLKRRESLLKGELAKICALEGVDSDFILDTFADKFCACPDCKDSGWREDGKRCECFERERRRG